MNTKQLLLILTFATSFSTTQSKFFLTTLIETASKTVSEALDTADEITTDVTDGVQKIVTKTVDKTLDGANTVVNRVGRTVEKTVDKFGQRIDSVVNFPSNQIKKVKNGALALYTDAKGEARLAVTDIAKTATDSVTQELRTARHETLNDFIPQIPNIFGVCGLGVIGARGSFNVLSHFSRGTSVSETLLHTGTEAVAGAVCVGIIYLGLKKITKKQNPK